ncbi:TPA: phage protease [Pseudomonas aeruginosa]|uniref:phage protease n=1 Tax=Pseudomonas aeruginosa TaxID=287 RepID=UPI0005BE33C8|nr:phage protease [Pseudomonas aeruginosa]EIU1664341.1 phage protease [Pseudomonas aeruginosa]EIU2594991.1 phage protease [Pseudomonas aeruginosa]EIU2690097.1 phage protease [Pseudomonas aeruginosa]EIU2842789.1 phage protease [Pseudomonas aeruginosa]EIU9465437.1 phage protease [Pseudomonas aeruginosa]
MKKNRLHVAIAACSFQLPKLEDGSAWIQVTPAGEFWPMDGRPMDVPGWRIDAASAAAVIERARSRKTPPVLDYEHQTLKKEQNGQPAPAAGRFLDFEWREGSGLWGRVEYTARAAKLIEDGEYLYFSPVFSYAPDGTVLSILMGAMTNDPAIDGLEPLARRAAATFGLYNPDEETPVDELLKAIIAALSLKEGTTEAEAIAALTALKPALDAQATNLAKLRETLGLAKDADVEQIAAATAQLKVAAPGNPDPAKYVPVEVVAQLQGQVAALTSRINGGELDGLINSAIQEGRLIPSMEPWAREYGAKDLAGLKNYLGQAKPIAALTQQQSAGRTSVPTSVDQLDEAALAVCSALQIKPEDYLKTLKGQ